MSARPVVAESVAEPVAAGGPSFRSLAWLRRLAAALAVIALFEVVGILAISAGGDPRFPIALDIATIGFTGSVILAALAAAAVRHPREGPDPRDRRRFDGVEGNAPR